MINLQIPENKMVGFKSIGFLLVLMATILMMIAPSAMGENCLSNGQRCKSDGTLGKCCSTHCHQLTGHGSGKCKNPH